MAQYKMAPQYKRMKAVLAKIVQQLYAQHGVVTPEMLLEVAADPKSPIHSLFTWDQEKAAHLRRLDEARWWLRKVKVEVRYSKETQPIRVRAFVHVPQAGGYVPTPQACKQASYLESAIDELKKQIAGIQRTIDGLRYFATSDAIRARIEDLAKAMARARVMVGHLLDDGVDYPVHKDHDSHPRPPLNS